MTPVETEVDNISAKKQPNQQALAQTHNLWIQS